MLTVQNLNSTLYLCTTGPNCYRYYQLVDDTKVANHLDELNVYS